MRNRSTRWSLLGLVCVLALAACTGSQSGGSSSSSTLTATGGAPSSASSSPSVDPMAMARLAGLYDVVKTVTAYKNFSDIKVGDTFKRTYNVTLDCATGPCGGTVEIDAQESKQNLNQDVTYDASTRTYAFQAPLSSATCTGVDGKTYELKTTSTFTLTPTKVEATGSADIVTTFTASGTLKAIPHGAALSKGGCKVSTAKFKYAGQLK